MPKSIQPKPSTIIPDYKSPDALKATPGKSNGPETLLPVPAQFSPKMPYTLTPEKVAHRLLMDSVNDIKNLNTLYSSKIMKMEADDNIDIEKIATLTEAAKKITSNTHNNLRKNLCALGLREVAHDLNNNISFRSFKLEADLLNLSEQNMSPETTFKKYLTAVPEVYNIYGQFFKDNNLQNKNLDIKKIFNTANCLIKDIAEDKNQTIECTGLEDIGKLNLNMNNLRLFLVFSNLLQNAVKYTPEGGKIAVKFHNDDPENLKFSIEDNGYGVPKEYHDKIFLHGKRAPNVKDKIDGTGYGLNYVKGKLEEADGEISVESPLYPDEEIQKGTRFTVTIPII